MSKSMKGIYDKYGDGIEDPNLVVETDPLFRDVLGSGVTRRSFLKGSVAAAAAAAAVPYSALAAKDKKWDETVEKLFFKESLIKSIIVLLYSLRDRAQSPIGKSYHCNP